MKKLLIIDDQEDLLQLLSYLFESNYNVFTASNGSEGIQIAKEEVPDCILLDIQMPDVSGYDVVRALRDDEKTRDVLIVAISAGVKREQMEKSLEMGCNHFVSKPFEPLDLKSQVAQFIEQHEKTG